MKQFFNLDWIIGIISHSHFFRHGQWENLVLQYYLLFHRWPGSIPVMDGRWQKDIFILSNTRGVDNLFVQLKAHRRNEFCKRILTTLTNLASIRRCFTYVPIIIYIVKNELIYPNGQCWKSVRFIAPVSSHRNSVILRPIIHIILDRLNLHSRYYIL